MNHSTPLEPLLVGWFAVGTLAFLVRGVWEVRRGAIAESLRKVPQSRRPVYLFVGLFVVLVSFGLQGPLAWRYVFGRPRQ